MQLLLFDAVSLVDYINLPSGGYMANFNQTGQSVVNQNNADTINITYQANSREFLDVIDRLLLELNRAETSKDGEVINASEVKDMLFGIKKELEKEKPDKNTILGRLAVIKDAVKDTAIIAPFVAKAVEMAKDFL